MERLSQLIDKMKLLYDLKKYHMAVDLLKSEPALMERRYALFVAGRSYLRLKEEDKALLLFQKALAVDANYSGAKLEIAKIYTDTDPKKAIGLVRQCIEYNPLEPAYWGVLGSIYFAQEKYKKAAKTFEKYLELEPNDCRSIGNLAVCKGELGQLEESELLYKKAISLDPNYQNAFFNLAVYYSDSRRLKEAEDMYLQAIRLDPNNADCIYGLACVYALNAQVEKALSFLEQSIEMDGSYKEYVLTDVDFDGLREEEQYLELIK